MTDQIQLEINDAVILVGEIYKKKEKIYANSLGSLKTSRSMFVSQADEVLAETQNAIKKVIKESKILKKNVNIIFPDTYGYSAIVNMPYLTEKELISAIRYQADQFIPIPIDKVNLDLEIINENKEKKEMTILLVAASKNIIERICSAVDGAGLIPVSIESTTSAILRYLDYFLINSKVFLKSENIIFSIFLYMDLNSTTFLFYDILSANPLMIRSIPIGFEIFKKDIVSNYQIKEDEAEKVLLEVGFSDKPSTFNVKKLLNPLCEEFISELKRFQIAVKDKYNVYADSIFIIGYGTKILSFDSFLKTYLNLKVQNFSPIATLEQNKVTSFFEKDLPLFIPILGGGLRDL